MLANFKRDYSDAMLAIKLSHCHTEKFCRLFISTTESHAEKTILKYPAIATDTNIFESNGETIKIQIENYIHKLQELSENIQFKPRARLTARLYCQVCM